MNSQQQTTSTEEPATDSSLALTPDLVKRLALTNVHPAGWMEGDTLNRALLKLGLLERHNGYLGGRPIQLSSKGRAYLTSLEALQAA